MKVVGETVSHVAAGLGELDYEYYIELLQLGSVDCPLITHGLTEEEAVGRQAFLREMLGRRSSPNPPSSDPRFRPVTTIITIRKIHNLILKKPNQRFPEERK